MAAVDPIKIEGLDEFRRNLRTIDKGLPKGLRLAGNEAAQIVVEHARAQIPRRSGRAFRSVRATSTRTESRVTGGGVRAAYYPWLDFGGRVGRKKSVRRPFFKAGRYIYPSYAANVVQVHEALVRSLIRVAEEAGVSVDE